jgi:hypothetical protein
LHNHPLHFYFTAMSSTRMKNPQLLKVALQIRPVSPQSAVSDIEQPNCGKIVRRISDSRARTTCSLIENTPTTESVETPMTEDEKVSAPFKPLFCRKKSVKLSLEFGGSMVMRERYRRNTQ